MPLSNYSSSLPTDIILDSGVLYIGSTPAGVSRGGLKFSPNLAWRHIEFDGHSSNIAGLHRKTKMDPVISGNMMQFAPADILRLEPGATAATVSTTTTTTPLANRTLLNASTGYLANVRLIFQRASGAYVQVRFPLGYVRKYDFASTDNNEGDIPIEIEGVLDPAAGSFSPEKSPYVIEHLASIP